MLEQTGNILAVVADSGTAIFGAVISCGVIIIGASLGIGFIGAFASSAMARQPEASGNIFRSMIVSAALVEGITFFSLVICFLTVFWLKG
jgi:F-type H+-transporting ATPase subunit c